MDNLSTKSAFIAVIGRPNVGKSSFVNSGVGPKVAIVSDKPQTTRTRISGVLNREDTQLVFIDTPGFHKPKNLLGENMMKTVSSAMSDVDAVLFIVDASRKLDGDLPQAEIELLNGVRSRGLPAVLALNKIDLLREKDALLPLIKQYTDAFDFDAVIPISAATGDGVSDAVSELCKYTKPSPHFFGDDTVTDQPDRAMVCELIREKLLLSLDKEVPHGIAVDLEQFYERDNSAGEPVLEVNATIYCEKDSHKGIIIGKNGAMLKNIGTLARRDIEEFFGCKVNLKLWVKVRKDWRDRGGLIHSFGLDQ